MRASLRWCAIIAKESVGDSLKKKLQLTTNRPSKPGATVPANADEFINGKSTQAPTGRRSVATPRVAKAHKPTRTERLAGRDLRPDEDDMQRLSFDIPSALHKKVRIACIERGKSMTAEIERLLRREFGS